MNITTFIQFFAEQFDETESSELNKDTQFKDVEEWSSLTALSVIAMVEDELDVILRGDDILSSDTIEDLFNLINDRRKY
jgi:acyl carrier protein